MESPEFDGTEEEHARSFEEMQAVNRLADAVDTFNSRIQTILGGEDPDLVEMFVRYIIMVMSVDTPEEITDIAHINALRVTVNALNTWRETHIRGYFEEYLERYHEPMMLSGALATPGYRCN